MAAEHLDSDTEELWQEFHRLVNMTGEELREWLLTNASGPEGFVSAPDMNLPETGRHVVHIVGKRRVDLTNADLEMMRLVVEAIRSRLAHPHESDDEWRRAIMTLGHDPLRPESPRPGEDTTLEEEEVPRPSPE
ncbi:DUF3140 domain-containing protein [Salinactinospora qingdaonensis]|uniref:DUF3140 domain-containing protein n=1 Tax=Salinactinospora qingdaonensis TaxID=702744 RepID=A0ABP7FJZ4_9ACTN